MKSNTRSVNGNLIGFSEDTQQKIKILSSSHKKKKVDAATVLFWWLSFYYIFLLLYYSRVSLTRTPLCHNRSQSAQFFLFLLFSLETQVCNWSEQQNACKRKKLHVDVCLDVIWIFALKLKCDRFPFLSKMVLRVKSVMTYSITQTDLPILTKRLDD